MPRANANQSKYLEKLLANALKLRNQPKWSVIALNPGP